MTDTRIVAVAGTNVLKIRGTKTGLSALFFGGFNQADLIVRGVEIPDCPFVPPQPFGFKQTRQGALYRAKKALDADPEATYGFGLENGVLLLDEDEPACGGVDVPVGCVVHRGGWTTYATGPGTPVEGRYILASLASDQQITCGKSIAAETGFDHANWHRSYTGQVTDREGMLVSTAFLAFACHFSGH